MGVSKNNSHYRKIGVYTRCGMVFTHAQEHGERK